MEGRRQVQIRREMLRLATLVGIGILIGSRSVKARLRHA